MSLSYPVLPFYLELKTSFISSKSDITWKGLSLRLLLVYRAQEESYYLGLLSVWPDETGKIRLQKTALFPVCLRLSSSRACVQDTLVLIRFVWGFWLLPSLSFSGGKSNKIKQNKAHLCWSRTVHQSLHLKYITVELEQHGHWGCWSPTPGTLKSVHSKICV